MASLSKLPSTCPQGTYEKKFSGKLMIFVFSVFWATIFDIMFFLGHGSQEKLFSRCPEDEFKKQWKFKFFLSLSYLQLIFPALRTELRGRERGVASFQGIRPVEPWGEVKSFVKLLHYLSFSGIESLSGSLLLNLGCKKSCRVSELHSICPEKRFEERFF